jgi:hypothetical protein
MDSSGNDSGFYDDDGDLSDDDLGYYSGSEAGQHNDKESENTWLIIDSSALASVQVRTCWVLQGALRAQLPCSTKCPMQTECLHIAGEGSARRHWHHGLLKGHCKDAADALPLEL